MQCSETRRRATVSDRPRFESLEARQLLHAGHSDFHVQFAPERVTPADGYVLDFGSSFTSRENGMNFGWTRPRSAKPVVRRDTPQSPDSRYDSFVQVKRDSTWELALPNGTYTVHLVAGDSKAKRGAYGFDVEGTPLLRAETTRDARWAEGTATVTVTDGALTLTAAEGYKKNRINFLDVSHVGDPGPEPGDPGDPPPDPGPGPGPDPGDTVTNWRSGRDAPIERAEAVGTAVGAKLYVFGGINAAGSNFAYPITARVDVYDPAADTWTRLRDMPEAFTHTNATVDGTTIWFVGSYLGRTPGPGTTHVWKYDTLTDSWSRGPDLPQPRGSGASALLGRTLHYFGGADDQRRDQTTHWSLNLDDPTGTWVKRADMPMSRNHMSGVALGGKIYAIGGQTGDRHAARDVANVDIYDPVTNTWSAAAPLPDPRSHTNCSTLVFGDRILVIGGESGHGTFTREIFAYDPATNAWSVFARLPNPRSTAVAGIINGQLVLATGNAPGISNDTWIGSIG